MSKILTSTLLGIFILYATISHQVVAGVSNTAKKTAEYAVATYDKASIESLRQLIAFNTVAVEGTPSPQNPIHQAFKQTLKEHAQQLGLDYVDHGYLVVIGLGKGEQRIGMVTHGDVQPVTPSKWKKSPFELDLESEPGKLIGRGTEDDKAPIVNALYAMKSIKDQKLQLNKRIELYIYMAEESDWEPLKEYIKKHSLPQVNITLDSEYPAVTAEKGYGTLSLLFSAPQQPTALPFISSFSGGFFASQIPEDAAVVIENADETLRVKLENTAKLLPQVNFSFALNQRQLTIKALGRSAHSSKPEDGINAITHLAALLNYQTWPNNTSGALVNFINQQLGTNLYGENFGSIAYRDDFMGPMTVQPTVIQTTEQGLKLTINIRRPRGKTATQLEQEFKHALTKWQQQNSFTLQQIDLSLNDPFVQDHAPQINTLLDVFAFYAKVKDPQPISIGAGTNSRLFPGAVSFGPAMPGKEYTGHSEHEFITRQQFLLNLKMYTAVLVELAKK